MATITEAIKEFKEQHKRLYGANKIFFEAILENTDKIDRNIKKIFSYSNVHSVYIHAENKLSSQRSIVLRISHKHCFIESVVKYAIHHLFSRLSNTMVLTLPEILERVNLQDIVRETLYPDETELYGGF